VRNRGNPETGERESGRERGEGGRSWIGRPWSRRGFWISFHAQQIMSELCYAEISREVTDRNCYSRQCWRAYGTYAALIPRFARAFLRASKFAFADRRPGGVLFILPQTACFAIPCAYLRMRQIEMIEIFTRDPRPIRRPRADSIPSFRSCLRKIGYFCCPTKRDRRSLPINRGGLLTSFPPPSPLPLLLPLRYSVHSIFAGYRCVHSAGVHSRGRNLRHDDVRRM